MGSEREEARDREQPVHEVTIDYDIMISKYLVTVEDYMLYAQATGAEVPTDKHTHLGFDVPVRRIRWYDARDYCRWKSQREGVTYRLPTEAEWEYACRAGFNGNYGFDESKESLDEYAWYKKNSNGITHNVGLKRANSWGLFDMHGNLWEWCADDYALDYTKTPVDGSAYQIKNEKGMVLRGGSWSGIASNCRASSRINLTPNSKNYFCGFRVVIELP
jgi:formylglycine-generating enzyme required for sulfatase activity